MGKIEKKNPTWFLAVKGENIRKPMVVSPTSHCIILKG